VVHKANYSSAFYAYRLGVSGLSPNPVISTVGSIHTPFVWQSGNAIGTMKISPTGKKLGLCSTWTDDVELFDFDPVTGKVTNSFLLDTNFHSAYGCEFSPDGTKFYVTGYDSASSWHIVKQWDIAAGTTS